MSTDRPDTHPYSLEVTPPAQPGGSYQWAIRRSGKLLQRSDRRHASEAKAREHGEAELERLLRGG